MSLKKVDKVRLQKVANELDKLGLDSLADQLDLVMAQSVDAEDMVDFELVNLTPHPISLADDEGNIIETLSSKGVARVSSTSGERKSWKLPVPVRGPDVFGEVIGLPGPAPGVYFIVSAMVGNAVKNRPDVLMPGTGPADNPVRNEQGHIVAVRLLKSTI